jgi:hypothetical protein
VILGWLLLAGIICLIPTDLEGIVQRRGPVHELPGLGNIEFNALRGRYHDQVSFLCGINARLPLTSRA